MLYFPVYPFSSASEIACLIMASNFDFEIDDSSGIGFASSSPDEISNDFCASGKDCQLIDGNYKMINIRIMAAACLALLMVDGLLIPLSFDQNAGKSTSSSSPS